MAPFTDDIHLLGTALLPLAALNWHSVLFYL